MILMYLHSKTYVTFRFLVISDVFFFPLPKFKHLDLRLFYFYFRLRGWENAETSAVGSSTSSRGCGWPLGPREILCQYQIPWYAQYSFLWRLPVPRKLIYTFDSCECPPSTECRYSYTDTTRGAYVYTCNTEVNKFAFFSENFKKQIFRVSSSPAAEPDAVRGVQPSW